MKNSAFLIVFLIVAFVINNNVKAQSTYRATNEFGFAVGGTNYYGDINTDFGFSDVGLSAGIFYRRNLNYYISLKGGINYGKIEANDYKIENTFQQTRNLSFQSDIWEATGQVELNFMKFKLEDTDNFFSPYLTTGISVFRFNPKSFLNEELVELNPFGTEGQNNPDISGKNPYNLTDYAFPIGLGFKYWIGGRWSFGADITYRMSRTDFLDDINDQYVDDFLLTQEGALLADKSPTEGNDLGETAKQRGNPLNNDDFLFGQMYLAFTFKNKKCPYSGSKQSGKLLK